MLYYGTEGDYNVMVMDILGPTIFKIFEYCDYKYSLKTMCMIALYCIEHLELMHDKGFIHRDIKPENFLLGFGKKCHVIYAIYFGLTKSFVDPKTGDHISFKENKGVTGTLRYLSLNGQLGNEQSRRDDMEALGFMLAYFALGGKLPWMGLPKMKPSAKE